MFELAEIAVRAESRGHPNCIEKNRQTFTLIAPYVFVQSTLYLRERKADPLLCTKITPLLTF